MEFQLHSIKLESYNAWTQNRFQQLALIDYNGNEQFTEWEKEKIIEGKRCFYWNGSHIKFDIDNNSDALSTRVLIYGKGLLVQKVLLGEEILNLRDKVPSSSNAMDSELVSFSIGIKNQTRKANTIIAKIFFRGIVTYKDYPIKRQSNNFMNDNVNVIEVANMKQSIFTEEIEETIQIPLIVSNGHDDDKGHIQTDSSLITTVDITGKFEEQYEKYNHLLGLIPIEAIEHKMLMDGIEQSKIDTFLSQQRVIKDSKTVKKPPPPSVVQPPPRPPPPPPMTLNQIIKPSPVVPNINTSPAQQQPSSIQQPPPRPPPPPPRLSTPPRFENRINNDVDTPSSIESTKSLIYESDGLTNKTPFVITKRKDKVKDYTNVKGFRENMETVLYSAEAQCAQLEAVLSFNEISISEIMIKVESFVKDIRSIIDRDIVTNNDKNRLRNLADSIEITLSSNPPLHASSQYQHLDKMRILNQRSKDTTTKLNNILTYLSQTSISQVFIDNLDKEIETNNIGHFSCLDMTRSKLELLHRNLSSLSLKLSNLLRPNLNLLKMIENRILDQDANFLNSDFILNYVDPNDGLNIGSLLVRARSISILQSVYSWPSLMVLSQTNKFNINSNEMKLQRRKSWVQISNTNVTHKVEYIEAKKVNIADIDFSNPSDLRCKGFTLEQLKLSTCFTDKEIMNAGFAMKDLKVYGNLSVADFRAAGLDINACREAGFTPIQLRQGGFDEVTVVRYGGFTIKQLKSSGCDIQRHALMGFFDSLDGHHWKNKNNWGTNRPLNEWHGIVLNGAGEVIRIDLRCNGLRGTIPESLIYLTSLEYMDLYHNKIFSPIPEALKNLKQLKNLWLNENCLQISSIEKSILATHLTKCVIRV